MKRRPDYNSPLENLFRNHRPCPRCNKTTLPVQGLLLEGSQCTNCHRYFAIDRWKFAPLPIGLALINLLAVETEYIPHWIALISIICLFLFFIFHWSLVPAWFPVKQISDPRKPDKNQETGNSPNPD